MRIPAIAMLVFFALSLGISSAVLQADDALTTRDGKIEIKVPDDYDRKNPGKATIKIEAMNSATGAAVLLLSEARDEKAALDDFAEQVRQHILEKLHDGQSDDIRSLEVNKCPALSFAITGIGGNGQRLAFVVTVIQTPTRFVQVVCTCPRLRLTDLRAEFTAIVASVKELAGSKP